MGATCPLLIPLAQLSLLVCGLRFEGETSAGLLISHGNADARFDVVGAPYSLLSVSLSASQNLYTRRGTLVGLSGKADNVR
jgi:hypothetical protein